MEKLGLIFDVDGTLWDSTAQVAEAWNEVLKEEYLTPHFTSEDFHKVMGLPMTEIGEKLFPAPQFNDEERNAFMEKCLTRENEYLISHPGILYPKEIECLKALSKQFNLYIVSNCQVGYIESFLEGCKCSSLFLDHKCWGENRLLKHHNILKIIEDNHLSRAVYIGDTNKDQEETALANIPFIHAAYGFGYAKDPDFSIKDFSSLLDIAPQALKKCQLIK
jgi:phosphoglycolate phosphatase